MPLRRYFAARGVKHPGAYSNLVLALGVLACMAIAVGVSVQASNRAVRQGLAQERAAEEKTKAATCLVIQRINNAYESEPPSTPAGREVAEAWRLLAPTFQCERN